MAAFLALLAIGFYVVVYTLLLKRTTPQNIVLGGAAGALPPVIGWAAVTGDIALPALLLFAIVFYWTPPHFWALSLRIRGDYAAASVPMLPVTHGVPETTRQIALYSVLMVALTLVFFAVAQMGLVFLAGALVLGGLFLFQAFAMWREGTDAPRRAALQVLDHLPGRAVRAHRAGRRGLPAAGLSQPAAAGAGSRCRRRPVRSRLRRRRCSRERADHATSGSSSLAGHRRASAAHAGWPRRSTSRPRTCASRRRLPAPAPRGSIRPWPSRSRSPTGSGRRATRWSSSRTPTALEPALRP